MSVDKVKSYFKDTPIQVIELEESIATVALAAEVLNCEEGRIAKTMSFLVKDQPILIVTSGDTKIKNGPYKRTFGVKAKMIPWDDTESYIGHAPGGVCPFGVNDNVKIYLDESLKKYDFVYPAAGDHHSIVKVTIDELEQYTDYQGWVNVCEVKENA